MTFDAFLYYLKKDKLAESSKNDQIYKLFIGRYMYIYTALVQSLPAVKNGNRSDHRASSTLNSNYIKNTGPISINFTPI